MKTLKQILENKQNLNENIDIKILETRTEINNKLSQVLASSFKNPYSGIEAIRKTLLPYGIYLPNIYLDDYNQEEYVVGHDEMVFVIETYGVSLEIDDPKTHDDAEEDYYIYVWFNSDIFTYSTYNFGALVVNYEEICDILSIQDNENE